MSGFQDPYARSYAYYHDKGGEAGNGNSHRSPDYGFDRDRDPYYDRDREYHDKDYGDSNDSYRSSSRYRDRSRSRSRTRSRSPYERRRSRHRRSPRDCSRDRSYSRERRYRDEDGDRSSRDRDRYYDELREERHRRHSYDDDRSSRGGSYDSGKSSKRGSEYGGYSDRGRYRNDRRGGGGGASSSNRVKDEWLAHVWGDGIRPDNLSNNIDIDLVGENYDRTSYKSQVPNKTLILRGLGHYVNEKDIKDEIIRAGGNPRDVRLIRKKDTGSSRGFAFVEFYSTEDARSMVERHDGELRLLNQKAVMQYSIQRDLDKEAINSDWYCRCYALNFKRREFCYRCGSDRKNGECTDLDESSQHPTHTVLLKGLNQVTTEESVLKTIQTLSSLPIRSVRIGRDKLTNASRGVCYLEMNNVSDAMYLHNTLLTQKPRIDGRQAYVSYCKSIAVSTTVASAAASNAGNAAIAAAQWSHQKNEVAQLAAAHDVPRLAEYSASLYAKTPAEREAYVKHYIEYYQNVIREGGTLPTIDTINSASTPTTAVAAGFSQQLQVGAVTSPETRSVVVSAAPTKVAASGETPDGNGDHKYPVPDVSAYQYDKTSGYYYDPYTTLYYDAKSQYYFNSKTNKFLYWDGTKSTYLLAPTGGGGGGNASETPAVSEREEEKKGKEKQEDKDKVKVAKRIAKDMEKWAKTLNHKKEAAKQNLVASQVQPVLKAQGVADIGYTVGVLGKKDSNGPLAMNPYMSPQAPADSLVAEYGGHGSDSEDEQENEELQQDDKHVDWTKMACLLCKRAFPNQETLLKHQQLSDLHKQNLEAWYRSIGISTEDARQRSVQYRDRAKERRGKYNGPEVAPSNRLKENYMKAREATVNYEQPTKACIGGDNMGNKLLQKMGWQEGMGLGKSNQGRTDIIQAEARSMSAGLGSRAQGVTPGPGETYKDCVKKMMRARYEEVNSR